jgi:hypothetical protein
MTTPPWAEINWGDDRTVAVPVGVLARALWKARIEYENVAEQCGHDIGPQGECWVEFERLAEYLEKPA